MNFGSSSRPPSTRRPPAGLSRATQWKLILLIVGLGVVIILMDLARDPTMWRAFAPQDGATTTEPTPSQSLSTEVDAEPLFLSREQWGVVVDNTPGLSRAEGTVLEAALSELNNTRHATLRAAARDDVVYSVLMADSEVYRGQLITITGTLRRLTPFQRPLNENDSVSLGPLVEGWLFTDDSDARPYRVISLGAEESIPRGESIDSVGVRVSGVFFKRQTYASQGGVGVAPVLLAKRIDALPSALGPPRDRLSPVLTSAILVTLVAIFGAFLATMRRTARRKLEFRLAAADLPAPENVPSEPPHEFLSQLTLDEDGQ